MRASRVRPAQPARVARPASSSAPIQGLNLRDSIAAIGPQQALVLNNFFPRSSYVQTRGGSQAQVTGFPSQVGSVMPYNGLLPANDKLFGACNTGIYDVTAAGTLGANLYPNITSGRCNYVNFGAGGGTNYLIGCNGTDSMFAYDGSGFQVLGAGTGVSVVSGSASGTTATLITSAAHQLAVGTVVVVTGATPAAYNGTFVLTAVTSTSLTYATLTAPGGVTTVQPTYTYTPGITGLNTNTVSNVWIYNQRLWMAQKGTQNMWYLPAGQVGGTAVMFPLQGLFTLGGYIVAGATWTLDGGAGLSDFMVVASSMGELALFQGTNPGDPTAWNLLGVYKLAAPLSGRCFQKWGGDLLYMAVDGIYPLSKALQSSSIDRTISISNMIDNGWLQAVTANISNYGWTMALFLPGPFILCNVPSPDGTLSTQFVMNTQTKAWCTFSGMGGVDWAVFHNQLYFANSSGVYQAWIGNSDLGNNIIFDAKSGFDDMGSPGIEKHVKLVRPILSVSNPIAISVGINVDYEDIVPSASYSVGATPQSTWDSSKWDSGVWAYATVIQRTWQTVACTPGYTIATRLHIETNSVNLQWAATNMQYMVGSGL